MTEDEDKIWQEAISGVKRINTDKVESHKNPTKKIKKEIYIPVVSREGFSADLELSDFHNVDASTAKKIKRNKFEIEAKLDLHGYTVDKAFDAVRNFIQLRFAEGFGGALQ